MAGEYQGVKIVALEAPVARLMVRAVPAPAPAMHHVAVDQGRHDLHPRDRQDRDRYSERPIRIHAAPLGLRRTSVHAGGADMAQSR